MQGVGFRPYVYRLAARGGARRLRAQRRARRAARRRGRARRGRALRRAAAAPRRRRWPRIESVAWTSLPPTGRARLPRSSRAPRGGEPDAPVAADAATCDDCLAELLDPADRRYRYPFVNCTNCGPRFTIVRGVPYDRPLTTMAGFAMCAACQAEYDDPRRPPLPRPAQRVPGLRADRAARGRDRRPRAAPSAAAALLDGAIVAVKGLGGYHLACRADDEERGRAAARAQAPRGPAVRAHGAPTSRRRGRWSSWGRPRRRCWPAASGRSCSRRGAPARPSRRRSPRAAPSSA